MTRSIKSYTIAAMLMALALLALTACNTNNSNAPIVRIAPDPTPTIAPSPTAAPATPTPAPTEPPAAMPPAPISPYGRGAAAEFLLQYVSLFSFGFVAYDGTYRNFAFDELYPPPLVRFEGLAQEPWVHYSDPDGNLLCDSPFVRNEAFAASFRLFNFGNDGKPDIIIMWAVPQTCAASWEVHRYIDGAYEAVGSLGALHGFYHDSAGRLVVAYRDFLRDVVAHYYLIFTADGMIEEPIPAAVIDFIGPLTPILPLTELEEELTASIRERLYAGLS